MSMLKRVMHGFSIFSHDLLSSAPHFFWTDVWDAIEHVASCTIVSSPDSLLPPKTGQKQDKRAQDAARHLTTAAHRNARPTTARYLSYELLRLPLKLALSITEAPSPNADRRSLSLFIELKLVWKEDFIHSSVWPGSRSFFAQAYRSRKQKRSSEHAMHMIPSDAFVA